MEGIRKINLAVNLIAAIACGISAIVYMDITLAIMTIIFVIITNNYKPKNCGERNSSHPKCQLVREVHQRFCSTVQTSAGNQKTQASNSHFN